MKYIYLAPSDIKLLKWSAVAMAYINNIRAHWEKIYNSKESNELSWTQDIPKTSLDLIHSYHLPKTASIIDVGGGDSKLVDFLLAGGYNNVTVLDISQKALSKTKARLGEDSKRVKWIVSDITEFEPQQNMTYGMIVLHSIF